MMIGRRDRPTKHTKSTKGMSVMMEAHEWRAVFASLPEPTVEELARFIEQRREEFEEEMRWFARKWEGRTVPTKHTKGTKGLNTEAQRHGE